MAPPMDSTVDVVLEIAFNQFFLPRLKGEDEGVEGGGVEIGGGVDVVGVVAEDGVDGSRIGVVTGTGTAGTATNSAPPFPAGSSFLSVNNDDIASPLAKK